ncbi:hypothetical protein FHX49_000608 [Microbacterium endophyticum]|uniref:Excalibur calcium-binding domain-containing protein n=1 Tax=Microbacterium endophyticum TaxID=1526412 RepID=A0A7W4YMF8_9MICO|nr:excalibur calcium-binding domain-containing protein [Microbacterium endophyticum]MBB2975067.1 hypothetical protein [Microbacterium endophyticum]NIK37393.1 hypothetical protein [Microbacterium endophyticum]
MSSKLRARITRSSAKLAVTALVAVSISFMPQQAMAAESPLPEPSGSVAVEPSTSPTIDVISSLLTDIPTISGTPKVGSTLTVNPGEWEAGASFSYQWFADDAPLLSATQATLKLANTMAGTRITVQVTGAKESFESASETSPATSVVTGGILAAVTPKISGTAAIGSKLTAVTGSWTIGTALSFQWCASGKAISGATSSTYVVTSSLSGAQISVKVTGAKSGFTSVSKTSSVTARVLASPVPKISGSAAVGAKLTAKPGSWTSGTTLKYQWYADGKAISKATGATYTVSSSLAGKSISVKISGAKSGYVSVSRTSSGTALVLLASTPKLSGTAAIGSKLTVSRGSWTSGTTFKYQWYASGKAISGATSSIYVVTSARAGAQISVKVTGSKSGFTTVAKTSTSTAKVLAASTPKISGSVKAGSTLSAKPGSWTSGTTLKYQWYANGKAISKATGATYTTTASTVGKKITLRVTGSKSGYVSVSRTSAATATIVAPPKPPKPAAPAKPSRPADNKNCSDFASQAAAQAAFNKYYRYYGDVFGLDADMDRIACESLR